MTNINKNFKDAPVLLITFNRYEYTRKVFDKIREAKVKTLYVANDAPRPGNQNDEINRNRIREMLNEIDWECNLHTLFHKNNQGNGFGPVAALNWVFDHEEKAIILEDDCVPALSFFDFCNHCLEKYKYDERIWLITGRSLHQNHPVFKKYDYIFSRFANTLGWASWKRCWQHFDMKLKEWPAFYADGGFHNVMLINDQAKIMNKFYEIYTKKPVNSWDARWGFAIQSNSGYGVVPSKNLIENIGVIGAHTKEKSCVHALKASENYEFTKEPRFVVLNREYEWYNYKNHTLKTFKRKTVYKRIITKVKRVFKHYIIMPIQKIANINVFC